MRHILLALTLLALLTEAVLAETDTPIVYPLPEGHVLLDYIPIFDTQPEETLLLLGCKHENAVKLAVTRRIDTGSYLLTTLSGPIFALDSFVPEQAYMQSDMYSLYLWYGVRNGEPVDEVFLSMDNGDGTTLQIRNGYVSRRDSPVKYSFAMNEPGLLFISGELPCPELEWPTDISMSLNDFTLSSLEAECLLALDCLKDLTAQYDEGDDIPGYTIHW